MTPGYKRIGWVWLGSDSLRFAMATRSLNGVKLEAMETVSLPDGGLPNAIKDEINLAINCELTRWQAAHPDIGEVHIVLPAEQCIYRVFSFPFGDTEKVRQVLPLQLEGDLPFALDGAWISLFSAGRSGSGAYRIVAQVLSGERVERLKALLPPGLPVAGLWSGMTGLLWQADWQLPISLTCWADGRHAAAVGWNAETITVRAVDLAGETPVDVASWLEEISETLGHTPQRIAMAENDFWPLSAIALARPLPETGNFWRSKLEPEQKEAGRRALKRATAALALVILLGAVDLWMRAWTTMRQDSAIKTQNRQLFSQAMPQVSVVLDEPAQLKSALRGVRQDMEALSGLHHLSTDAERILSRLLQRMIERGALITDIALDDRKLVLRGEAADMGSVKQWVDGIGPLPGMKPPLPVAWEPRGAAGSFTVTWEWENRV